MADLLDVMLQLKHELLISTGKEPTAFILGASRLLEFKLNADALRQYEPTGYAYCGIPILATEIDPDYIGIAVPVEIAITRYGARQLDQHPNGKSGAW